MLQAEAGPIDYIALVVKECAFLNLCSQTGYTEAGLSSLMEEGCAFIQWHNVLNAK